MLKRLAVIVAATMVSVGICKAMPDIVVPKYMSGTRPTLAGIGVEVREAQSAREEYQQHLSAAKAAHDRYTLHLAKVVMALEIEQKAMLKTMRSMVGLEQVINQSASPTNSGNKIVTLRPKIAQVRIKISTMYAQLAAIIVRLRAEMVPSTASESLSLKQYGEHRQTR